MKNNCPSGNVSQSTFTETLAHELLHHWWTYYHRFEKLKWRIIRDQQPITGYSLDDVLDNDTNNDCSEGEGHEKNNPENFQCCNIECNY